MVQKLSALRDELFLLYASALGSEATVNLMCTELVRLLDPAQGEQLPCGNRPGWTSASWQAHLQRVRPRDKAPGARASKPKPPRVAGVATVAVSGTASAAASGRTAANVVPPGLKKCQKCGDTKPLAEYQRHTQTWDGKHPMCDACRAQPPPPPRRRAPTKPPLPEAGVPVTGAPPNAAASPAAAHQGGAPRQPAKGPLAVRRSVSASPVRGQPTKPDPAIKKKCRTCSVLKPLGDFARCTQTTDNKHPSCNQCRGLLKPPSPMPVPARADVTPLPGTPGWAQPEPPRATASPPFLEPGWVPVVISDERPARAAGPRKAATPEGKRDVCKPHASAPVEGASMRYRSSRAAAAPLLVPEGQKRCRACQRPRPLKEFERHTKYADDKHPDCNDCRGLHCAASPPPARVAAKSPGRAAPVPTTSADFPSDPHQGGGNEKRAADGSAPCSAAPMLASVKREPAESKLSSLPGRAVGGRAADDRDPPQNSRNFFGLRQCPPVTIFEAAEKCCSVCRQTKPITSFDRCTQTMDGRFPACSACEANAKAKSKKDLKALRCGDMRSPVRPVQQAAERLHTPERPRGGARVEGHASQSGAGTAREGGSGRGRGADDIRPPKRARVAQPVLGPQEARDLESGAVGDVARQVVQRLGIVVRMYSAELKTACRQHATTWFHERLRMVSGMIGDQGGTEPSFALRAALKWMEDAATTAQSEADLSTSLRDVERLLPAPVQPATAPAAPPLGQDAAGDDATVPALARSSDAGRRSERFSAAAAGTSHSAKEQRLRACDVPQDVAASGERADATCACVDGSTCCHRASECSGRPLAADTATADRQPAAGSGPARAAFGCSPPVGDEGLEREGSGGAVAGGTSTGGQPPAAAAQPSWEGCKDGASGARASNAGAGPLSAGEEPVGSEDDRADLAAGLPPWGRRGVDRGSPSPADVFDELAALLSEAAQVVPPSWAQAGGLLFLQCDLQTDNATAASQRVLDAGDTATLTGAARPCSDRLEGAPAELEAPASVAVRLVPLLTPDSVASDQGLALEAEREAFVEAARRDLLGQLLQRWADVVQHQQCRAYRPTGDLPEHFEAVPGLRGAPSLPPQLEHIAQQRRADADAAELYAAVNGGIQRGSDMLRQQGEEYVEHLDPVCQEMRFEFHKRESILCAARAEIQPWAFAMEKCSAAVTRLFYRIKAMLIADDLLTVMREPTPFDVALAASSKKSRKATPSGGCSLANLL